MSSTTCSSTLEVCGSILSWPRELRLSFLHLLSPYDSLVLRQIHSSLVPDSSWQERMEQDCHYYVSDLSDVPLAIAASPEDQPFKWRTHCALYWLLHPLCYLCKRSVDFYSREYCSLWAVQEGRWELVNLNLFPPDFQALELLLQTIARGGMTHAHPSERSKGNWDFFEATLQHWNIYNEKSPSQGNDGKEWIKYSNIDWLQVLRAAIVGGSGKIVQYVTDQVDVKSCRWSFLYAIFCGYLEQGNLKVCQSLLEVLRHEERNLWTHNVDDEQEELDEGREKILEDHTGCWHQCALRGHDAATYRWLEQVTKRTNEFPEHWLLHEQAPLDPVLLQEYLGDQVVPLRYQIRQQARSGTLTQEQLLAALAMQEENERGRKLGYSMTPVEPTAIQAQEEARRFLMESLKERVKERREASRQELITEALLGACQGKRLSILSWLCAPHWGEKANPCRPIRGFAQAVVGDGYTFALKLLV